MFPSDVKDLITAFVLIVILVAGSAIYQTLYKTDEVLKEIKINDEQDLFSLNYLKTKISDGSLISELIIESENNDGAFETLKDGTEEIMNFAFVEEYSVIILYPTIEKKFGEDNFERYTELKLFDKDEEMILVKVGVRFKEGWV
ncbi:MAG: hypothetical protein KKG75_00615 [Nanoarchaeota archaeon]|nr:hypothetical protein [Nanoarchaeota archaeon]